MNCGERALESGERALQHHEARARELGGGLEIHEAQRLAELEMLLRLKRKLRRLHRRRAEPCSRRRPRRPARRKRACWEWWRAASQARCRAASRPLHPAWIVSLKACDLIHEALRGRFVLLRLGVADLLGGGVAPGLRLLQFLNRCAAFFVEAQKAIQRRARVVEAAIGQPLEEGRPDCRGSI